jgi:hypothetical protein
MTAVRAIELPDDLAEVLALAVAVHPGLNQGAVGPDAVGPDAEGPDAVGPDAVGPDAEGRSRSPEKSAARRAAVRWAQPAPAAALSVRTAPRDQAASTPLRLTRRGRIVAAAAAVVLLTMLSFTVAMSAQATGQAPARSGSGLTQVTVHPGQSLWSVAESADPNADTRAVVQQIVELNSLTGSAVFAGQRLWVPRG